ncbi:MAG TPA: CCC motif membrane protein [Bacteroidales bacterium]|nr:CCC motif membrane protein [Bacteroidales bacterium]HPS16364.1 CCC motif membrane protein [Bacteroidales bacterium]
MENQNFNQAPPPNYQNPQGFYQQPQLPNSTAVLVLGILSIVFCWGYGIVGLILGIIALSMSGKATATFNANPNMYSLTSYNNMKAGRVCAIIGTILSALFLIYVIIVIAFLGAFLSSMPWDMMNH